jgi:hypothetical protein
MDLGQKTLQYQEDIVEAEFKEIAAKGARVSLTATKKASSEACAEGNRRIALDVQSTPAACAASVPMRV